MKTKKIHTAPFFLLLLTAGIAIFLVLIPIPPASPNNCAAIYGLVEEIKAGEGEHDIVIALQDDDHYYYVNRGMERGLKPRQLHTRLLNQAIRLDYVKHWSPLGGTHNRHIARIEYQGQVLYSEMR